MGRWTNDRKITLGFVTAFALMFALPLIVYDNKSRLLDSSHSIAHTHEVIAQLQAVQLSLMQAESGERAYLITAREEYLPGYEAAAFDTKQHLARVRELTADNVVQQKRLEILKPLIASRIEQLEHAIGVRRTEGLDAAAEFLQSDRARKTSDHIRRRVGEMKAHEERLLGERATLLHTSVAQGSSVFWIITALNFVILGFSFYLVNRYITHRRRAEETLKQAKDAAEGANVAKSAFLANMSHEIRTPMTAILGYVDALLEPGQTQSDRLDATQTIRRNARHLMDLIDEVLDLSKIEAGKMTLERIACEPPQLLFDVISMMRPRATDKKLTLNLVFDGPVPTLIKTDPLRLKQVLVNLVGNAIKFTETGGVEVRVSCRRDAATAATTLVFAITDSGIGIDGANIERLFHPFTQADESMTRRFGGTGLGLSISQRLTRMLGGEMTLKSQVGAGSTFTVAFDVGPVADADMVENVSESIKQHAVTSTGAAGAAPPQEITLDATILLAEDGIDNQRLISTYLKRAGAEVVIAENGRVAVEQASSRAFDVILMDMQMPDVDGYAATSDLRSRGLAVPIIALTAHAMSEDRAKCLNAGCTDYLTKPVDRSVLLSVIKSYLPQTRAAAQDAKERPTVRSTFAGDPDMAEALAEYVANLPGQVDELLSLLERRDAEPLRRMVHQFKGSGGGYGFAAISGTAAKAERQILAGAAGDVVAASVNELVAVIRGVEGYAATSTTHSRSDPTREAA